MSVGRIYSLRRWFIHLFSHLLFSVVYALPVLSMYLLQFSICSTRLSHCNLHVCIFCSSVSIWFGFQCDAFVVLFLSFTFKRLLMSSTITCCVYSAFSYFSQSATFCFVQYSNIAIKRVLKIKWYFRTLRVYFHIFIESTDHVQRPKSPRHKHDTTPVQLRYKSFYNKKLTCKS